MGLKPNPDDADDERSLYCVLTAAIDTEAGLLCQSRDQQAWNGARSAKGVSGRGIYLMAHDNCCLLFYEKMNKNVSDGLNCKIPRET